jgi:hypothetical protein
LQKTLLQLGNGSGTIVKHEIRSIFLIIAFPPISLVRQPVTFIISIIPLFNSAASTEGDDWACSKLDYRPFNTSTFSQRF